MLWKDKKENAPHRRIGMKTNEKEQTNKQSWTVDKCDSLYKNRKFPHFNLQTVRSFIQNSKISYNRHIWNFFPKSNCNLNVHIFYSTFLLISFEFPKMLIITHTEKNICNRMNMCRNQRKEKKITFSEWNESLSVEETAAKQKVTKNK